jgi:hypothetical protein
VVETGGLENRLALTGYGGSNPSPSAKYSFKDIPEHSIDATKAQYILGFCILRRSVPGMEVRARRGIWRSGAPAGGDRFLFGREDGEEAEDADHLKRLRCERRWVDEPGIAAELAGAAEGADHSADARGVDKWHLFEVEDEIEAAAGKGGFKGCFEVGSVVGLEGTLNFEGAGGAALADVEIHDASCKRWRD